MKAIETVYDGYRFRSRLEARWAVFFKTMGIRYDYEMDGVNLDGTWYLPDFWLPEQKCWIEVKGQEPTPEEKGKAFSLTEYTGYPVFIFSGSIDPEQEAIKFEPTKWYLVGVDPISPCEYISEQEQICARGYSTCCRDDCLYETSIPLPHKISHDWLPAEKKYGRDLLHITIIDGRVVMEDPERYNQLEGMPAFKSLPPPLNKHEKQLKEMLTPHPGWMYYIGSDDFFSSSGGWQWYECEECGKVDIQGECVTHIVAAMCDCSCNSTIEYPKHDSLCLIAAYTAARSARFEHGENG